MFFSRLLLNPRSRRVLRDAADPYEMHRTVLRGFPDKANGGPGRVLWRLEREKPGRPRILLVQSEKKPDWGPLLAELPPYYLAEETRDGLANPDTKQRDPAFPLRQQFVFRLRANPTIKRDGKRHGLFREEDQLGWLARKGHQCGFAVRSARIAPEGTVRAKLRSPAPLAFFAVLCEGLLEVTDPAQFRATLGEGIGSAKGFGFGLLSLARPAPGTTSRNSPASRTA
jgi:CRISPR system Cascade subunit CasE